MKLSELIKEASAGDVRSLADRFAAGCPNLGEMFARGCGDALDRLKKMPTRDAFDSLHLPDIGAARKDYAGLMVGTIRNPFNNLGARQSLPSEPSNNPTAATEKGK